MKDAEENVGLFDRYNRKRRFSINGGSRVGLRQFGSQNLQRADFIDDKVKELVKNTPYEKDTNRAQVTRARENMDGMGVDAAAAMLIGKDKNTYTADDNVLALVAMAEAIRKADRQAFAKETAQTLKAYFITH